MHTLFESRLLANAMATYQLTSRNAVFLAMTVFITGTMVGAVIVQSGLAWQVKQQVWTESVPPFVEPEIPRPYQMDRPLLALTPENLTSEEQLANWQAWYRDRMPEIMTPRCCTSEVIWNLTMHDERPGMVIERFEGIQNDTALPLVVYRLQKPDIGSDRPGILVVPGSGIGVRGLLEPGLDYQDGAALRLAEQGFVVYAIENVGWGERRMDAGNYYSEPTRALVLHALLAGDPVATRYIHEAIQVIRWMHEDDGVSSDAMGVMGLSLGGRIAGLVASLAPDEVDAVVVASGLHGQESNPGPAGIIIPGMKRYADHPTVAAAIAPRPLLLMYGAQDNPPYRVEHQDRILYNDAIPAWATAGQPTALEQVSHAGGHEYDMEGVTAFFTRHLT